MSTERVIKSNAQFFNTRTSAGVTWRRNTVSAAVDRRRQGRRRHGQQLGAGYPDDRGLPEGHGRRPRGSASGPVRTRSDRAGSRTATEHGRRRPRTDRACRLPGGYAAGSRRNISRLHADLGVEVVVLGAANHVDVVHCIRVDGSAGSDHDIFMEDCPRGLAEGWSMRDDRPCPDPRFAPVDFEVSSLAESMSSCQAGSAGTEEGQAGSGRTGIMDAPTGDVLSRDFDRGAWMS